ncbi:hypothetical protein ACJX0J_019228, partial [Zea mays]
GLFGWAVAVEKVAVGCELWKKLLKKIQLVKKIQQDSNPHAPHDSICCLGLIVLDLFLLVLPKIMQILILLFG